MRLFSSTADKFNGAKAETKASIIAAICGWLGVFGGFVLYVVFTHLFEHGGVTAKIVGVAGGLAASIVIAWFAHRLWETIDEGRISLGWQSRRTMIAVVSLVVVFELSASAFEDFVRALSGDFDGIRRVAADIAGRDTQASDAIDAESGAALLSTMQTAVARLPRECPTCVTTPAARMFALLPRETVYKVFPAELKVSDDEIYAAFLDPRFRLLSSSPLSSACSVRLTVGTPPVWQTFGGLNGQQPARQQADIDKCRAELVGFSDAQRETMLSAAVRTLLSRHDLYDAASFKLDATGEPLKLGMKLRERLIEQRAQCEAIRAAAGAIAARMRCSDVTNSDHAKIGTGSLVSIGEMRAMNRELMAAALPGTIAPLPVYWWDLLLLFLIWSTAAVVVGVYLTIAVFSEPKVGATGVQRVGGQVLTALLSVVLASVLAGVMLVGSRFLPFLWQLMFDPASTHIESFHPLLAVIPWVVKSLADASWLGFSIPGWVTLPALVVGALLVWGAGSEKSDDGSSTFAGFALLGLILTSVAPVAGGLIGVVVIVAGAWLVPAVGLALLLPFLKPGSNLPQWWGVVSLFGGLAVAAWVATALSGDDVYRGALAVGGLVAAATGVLILRRVPVGELWPLLAITIGLGLVGGAAAFQQVTFGGALQALHPVSQGTAAKTAADVDLLNYFYRLRPEYGVREDTPEVAAAFLAPSSDDAVKEALRLELALTGSIGFWLTLGMLVAWSLKQGPRHKEGDAHEAA